MNKGIALQFKNKFNNSENLKNQCKNITELAHLKLDNQWILYLITKNNFYNKPTYSDIFKTLKNTKIFCVENKIKTLALPKICSGLDKKQWNVISRMIQFIFHNTNTKIRIYSLPKNENINEINNTSTLSQTTYNIISNDNINKNLKDEIATTASSFINIKNISNDGDCGAHALRICFQFHNIIKTTKQILNMINISDIKSGYYFTDNDLAFICDQLNLNLFIIHVTDNIYNAIIYWKPDRKCIGIFHEDCKWTPGFSTQSNCPIKFINISIHTIFPNVNIIKGNIIKHFTDQDNTNDNINILNDSERKQRVLSIPVKINNNNRHAILDTGSNISCIDISLVHNTENIKNKIKCTITGADDSELQQLGIMDLKFSIHNRQYSINAYVIKGLKCKLLLGNDFNIKNNLVINFDNKTIKINSDIIPMDNIWYNYYKDNSSIENITSINFKLDFESDLKENALIIPHKTKQNNEHRYVDTNEKHKEAESMINDKITISENTIMPLNKLTNVKLKFNYIKQNNFDKHFLIDSVDKLSQKYYLKTKFLKNDEAKILYNFSDIYNQIYENMTSGIINYNNNSIEEQNNKETILTINNTEEITDRQGTVIKISKDLNIEQREKAKFLINKFKHLFTSDPMDIGCANVEPCEIKLKSDKPIFQPPYRVSPTQREKLKHLINQMIDSDIVEPSRSNYAAPVFLIPKKEKDEYRFLVDYRKINAETIGDKYPIPRSQDLFRSLEGGRFYSTLDMAQGYFQIPIKKEDKNKTAFITDFGLYQFKRIPQGFKNSGPIFQRIINNLFSDYLYRTMIAYLDDICCFGSNFEIAIKRLEDVFIRLDEAGLKLKTSKCVFFSTEIELLGHKVSKNGLVPLERNVRAIENFPIPKKVKDVRAFVGLTSYYRKYIKNFAKIASPLTDLTKKENKFNWGETENNAFKILKKSIITAPVLAHFEDEYPVFVTTDASLEGLSGILEQENPNGKRHPIAFASRKLKGGEKNFSTTELEMSAVVYALNYFKEYLIGRKITVFSDHSSLQYFKTMKNPSSRITKFIFKLLEFDLEIIHKPGSWNLAADCLSRYPVENVNNLINELKHFKNTESSITTADINIDSLKENQLSDDFCNGIINALKTNINSKYKKKSRQYCIKDNTLYFKNWSPSGTNNLLVIPKNLINLVLKSYHESALSGHFGITKTLAKLKQKYYWPTIIQDTTHFIKTCISCQMIKKTTGKSYGLLQPIPLLTGKPLQRLTFDYLGPLPVSRGKKYIIVATCNATKMAFAKAVANANGAATINFLMDLITSYGVPKYFCSDRGTHFKNKEVEHACKQLGIEQIFSSAYHPQTNGMTELMNKIICNSLSHYVNDNQKDWSLYYKMVIFAYNTCPSSRLKVSPFYLLHGVEANQPLDNKLTIGSESFNITKSLKQLQNIRNNIPKIIEKEQAIQKKNYDQKHKNINFYPGQKVLIQFDFNEQNKSKKLANKYRGPFEIIEKISEVNYRVKLILKGKETIDVIHVQRMKPFYE